MLRTTPRRELVGGGELQPTDLQRESVGVVLGKVDDGVSSAGVNGNVRDVVWGIQPFLRRQLPRELLR